MTDCASPPRRLDLRTLSRHQAEGWDPCANAHCISITSSRADVARLSTDWAAVTVVDMADGSSDQSDACQRIARAASAAVAASAGTLVVHCEMGVSRSVGAALAIAAYYGVPYLDILPMAKARGFLGLHVPRKRAVPSRSAGRRSRLTARLLAARWVITGWCCNLSLRSSPRHDTPFGYRDVSLRLRQET